MVAPVSIRGQYGLTDTRNSVHGSGELNHITVYVFIKFLMIDSEESFLKESQFFFPDFDPIIWRDQHEPFFRQGNVYYDVTSGVHLVSMK